MLGHVCSLGDQVTMPEWNDEHLAKLREGVTAWNEWRKTNPYVQPDLEDADLRGLSLRGARLHWTNLLNTSMDGVDASEAMFYQSNLGAARLRGANLSSIKGDFTQFSAVSMDRAVLREAELNHCGFTGAEMVRVDLRRANVFGSVFRGTDLTNADFTDCVFEGNVFARIDFRRIRGLKSVVHRGPSTIGIDSLLLSDGQIPEVFLRGAGVSDGVIQYASSLVNRPIRFYSCFISHSTADKAIADRLYGQLQAQGVRCWYAPEDVKTGDKFRQQIDESVRLYEKLLVILSQASLASGWVESEVEMAFERERQTGKLVLFPIRIDRAAMDAPEPWAAEIRRTRHIGDFTGWKSEDEFRKAFDRLMRDLRA